MAGRTLADVDLPLVGSVYKAGPSQRQELGTQSTLPHGLQEQAPAVSQGVHRQEAAILNQSLAL